MRRFLLPLCSLALLTTTAHAAPPEPKPTKGTAEVRSQFYDFGTSVINGEIRRPAVSWTDAHQRSRFGKLSKMPNRTFLPDLMRSSAELKR